MSAPERIQLHDTNESAYWCAGCGAGFKTGGGLASHLRAFGTDIAQPEIAPKRQPADRMCAEPTCSTRLSIYNEDDLCSIHQRARLVA